MHDTNKKVYLKFIYKSIIFFGILYIIVTWNIEYYIGVLLFKVERCNFLTGSCHENNSILSVSLIRIVNYLLY